MNRERDRLVFATGKGRTCPHCGRAIAQCACRANPRAARGEGIVRLRREVQGRRGKTVTTISGVPLPEAELSELAGELKRRCGSGGSAKNGVIEIQGDHRDAVVAALEERGFQVKLAGG